ncbi:MAG: hypothetical protein WAW88_02790 [Nocardioides sp.]
MRRVGLAVLMAAIPALLAVGLQTSLLDRVGARFEHPDRAGFHAYVDRNIDGWRSSRAPGGPRRDKAWALAHAEEITAEGDRACAWLTGQRAAPRLDPSGHFGVGSAVSRYVNAMAEEHPLPINKMSRHAIVAGAWAYLCPSLRDLKTSPQTFDED